MSGCYNMPMAGESRRMSEPCQSTSKPVHSPEPPRSQSAAPPPLHNPNLNSGLADNMDSDNPESKFNIPDDIMQFINLVSIIDVSFFFYGITVF